MLFERDSVTAAADAVVASVLEGPGSVLFVVGEAGLGKTSLLDRAVAAHGDRVRIARAAAHEMEAGVAFGLAGDALEALGTGSILDLLAPGPSGVVEPATPYHRALRWMGERAEPALLLLDDLHWADVDSLLLLAFLCRRRYPVPLGVIATLRPWPADAEQAALALAAAEAAALERLSPLSRRGADDLVRQRLGPDVGEDVVEEVWRLSGGNPLLVEQAVQAVDPAQPDAAPDLHRSSPAADGNDLLLRRFAGLDDGSLACARGAAVLGPTFRPALLAEVVDLDPAAVDAALVALFRNGLLVEGDAGRAAFAHPLFAQALLDDLVAPEQRRLHRRCYEVLARRGLGSEAAEHALRADLVGDGAAIALLEQAGQDALAKGAVVNAGRLLEGAVHLSGDEPASGTLFAYAAALDAGGRAAEVAEVCRRLLRGPLPWADEVEALRMLGRAECLTAAPGGGEEALAASTRLALEHDPPRAVQPLLDHGLAAWYVSGPSTALPYLRQARDLTRGTDGPLAARAEAAWTYVALETGDPEGQAAAPGLLVGLAEEVRTVDLASLPWPWNELLNGAMVATYLEHHDLADDIFRAFRTAAEQADAAHALASMSMQLAHLARLGGSLDVALAEATRAEEAAELVPGVVLWARLARAEALIWLGRYDEAAACCAAVDDQGQDNWTARLWLSHVRGLLRLSTGDAVGASDDLRALEDLCAAIGVREPCHLHWAGHAVAAHLAADRRPDAERVVAWLEDCGAGLPCRWPRFAATLGRARLAEHAGDDDEAIDGYRAALDALGPVDLPLHRIEALLALGTLLRRRGRLPEARGVLADASTLAAKAGAAALEATAQSERVLAGGRRRRRHVPDDALTPAEQRVARQASLGLSNQEIADGLLVSVHTVQSHLKRVYAKLGIRSRRDLIRRGPELLASEEDLGPAP